MELVIRTEVPDDADGIRRVHVAAFARDAEAELVDAVREARASVLSLVAAWHGNVVGHALFTPVTVGSGSAVALGPLAVHPDHQDQGVGTALVREGLLRLSVLGHGAVLVVGAPAFYRRFGFAPARSFGIERDRPAPDEAFLALELRPRALNGGGTARYHRLFDGIWTPGPRR